MHEGREKNQVFGDYAAFLNALLPSAQGFLFHDRHNHLFWQDQSPDASELSDEYHRTLELTIKDGDLANEQGRVPLSNCTAYLIRLTSDNGHVLGVLTALVDRDMGNMPWKFLNDLLQPAIRCLKRELSLRVHLLDANQKLSKQGGEYDFLRQLGELTREKIAPETSLHKTLELCLDQLLLDGAVFIAPGRQISISLGPDPVDNTEAQLIFESLQDIVEANPADPAQALAMRPQPDERERSRYWPVIMDGRNLAGVLILSRPINVQKINDHTESLAGFVVSTIEYLLERGFDELTGLINWAGFEGQLTQACENKFGEHSLLYINVDQLDTINNTYGRESGDEILRKLAELLRTSLDGQLVTRITGDTFAALLQDCPIEQAERIANEVCESFNKIDYAENSTSFKSSVSIGVAQLEIAEDGPHNMLAPAEIACRAAKDRGRNRVEIYQSSDISIIRRMDDMNIVGSIKSAIEAGRLTLFAQPIVNLENPDESKYYELLVRLLDISGNPVEPADFMQAAERYQLMQEIDRWVVAKAIEALDVHSQSLDNQSLRFAVNLSGQSLGDDKFMEYVLGLLKNSQISPHQLCFEITETAAVSNLKKAQLFMSELKKMGCMFSLDDFGTGLSSFAYLKLFAVDKLKIDGSFIHDICENEVSRSMVMAVAEIARVMKLETVAEYVQDEATVELLRDIGIDWAQGFHVGEPARLSDIFTESALEDTACIEVGTSILNSLPNA